MKNPESLQNVLPYFSYAHQHVATRNDVPFHQHGGCELLLIVRGACRVESPSGVLEGHPGTLIVIPPGLRHNQINEPGERNLFCVFQASPELFPQHWRSIDVSGLGWVRRTFLELKSMTDRGDFTGAPALLCSLLQRLNAQTEPAEALHPGLREALRFMQNHFTEPLSVPAIAREAGVCPSFLRRLFQNSRKEAPLQYLQELRLERARILLRNPYLSVAEAAARSGFENSNYFIRLYKSRYGITPRRDRANLQRQG